MHYFYDDCISPVLKALCMLIIHSGFVRGASLFL